MTRPVSSFVTATKEKPLMRMAFAAPALVLALSLSGCGGWSSGGPNNDNEFYPNCAEQSGLATQGRTDGRAITITCP